MAGPLSGTRIVELAGIGPAPFAGMLLADLGADVVRVDRPDGRDPFPVDPRHDLLGRGKRSVLVDLKSPDGSAAVRALAGRADILIEGFRPGVAERLGVGPADCHAVNPALVYGRMTGWGQDGPLAQRAGHDIAYIALAGALHTIGPTADGPPVPPLNLLGDYGGGGMLLIVGVLAALLRARATGRGEVVDASIVDGAALLSTQVHGLLHSGLWHDRRAGNILDGAAPNYGVYRTADGEYLAVGPLEPKFWAEFASLVGLDPSANPYDRDGWSDLRATIAERIATRTRAEWVDVFDGSDACVAPVLGLREAANGAHPHLVARGTFVESHGIRQPAPAPRFADAPTALGGPPPRPGEHDLDKVLQDWLVTEE